MLLGVPVIAALLLGLYRGGSLRYLATLPVRGSGWLLGALAVQLLLYAPVVRTASWVHTWGAAIYIGALAMVLIGAWQNRHLGLAVRVATLGLALNALVITVNGGHMPVDVAAMRAVQGAEAVQTLTSPEIYSNTRIASADNRLTMLSDVLPLHLWHGFGNVYSVGDVLLTGGMAVTMYGVVRGRASVYDRRACDEGDPCAAQAGGRR